MNDVVGVPVVWALAVAAISALVTLAWIGWARAYAIEDQPGARRVHSVPTPRGGGIGIVAGLGAGFVWLLSAPTGAATGASPWPGLALAIGLFAALGLLDDVRPLGAAVKLAGQGVAAAVGVASLPESVLAGPFLLILLLALAWIGTVNLWNFMDGSNGMVTWQALLVAAAIALWPGVSPPLRWLALALAAACAGFLPFNFPRARVFLGDVGSHVLGATVFVLLALAWAEGALRWPQAGLLVSAMLLDGGLTLLRRARRGRPVWRAHREHLYQYAVRVGHSHGVVAMAYAGWTLAASVLAASPLAASPGGALGTFAAVMIAGSLCHAALRRRWLQRPDKEIRA